jgi:fused signal recognition particle receptor
MLEDALVPAVIVLVVIALVGGIAVARRRPSARRGPSSRADVEALGRVHGTDVEAAPSPSAPPEPAVIAEPETVRPSLRDRLGKSRRFLSDRLADALGHAPDEDTWDEVEAALIQADIGVEIAARLVGELKSKARERRIMDPEEVKALLADELVSMFDGDRDRALAFASDGVTVWIVVGVNGTGKTTTIGKLAADLRMHGRNVALAAADTFRAAADEQLAVWAQRSGAELVKHQPGADPGAVAFDAWQHARARDIDVLIVDTAGRLHTKTPLMDELAKVRRVLEREGSVQESLLVIDATAGQNGLVQARRFADATGVTGVVLTKLDGTAKGGIAVAIEATLGIPIKLVGVGERLDDVEPFDPKTYVDALLSSGRVRRPGGGRALLSLAVANLGACSTRSPTVSTASSRG